MKNAASTQVQNHFLDLSPDLMCIVAFNGNIQYINPCWEKLLGYSKEEIRSQTFLELIFGNGNNTIEKENFNLQDGKLPSFFESTLICKNGCLKNIQWSSDSKPKEKIIYFIGKDITVQKATEKQCQKSANLYRNLYNQTPAMVHSIGPDGCLLSASDLWLKNMGYKREEIIGKKSIEFLTPESQEYAKNIALPKFLENGKITDVRYDFITKQGEIINTLLSAIAEYGEDGKIRRTLAVIIDITLRKKAEDELKLSEQHLNNAITFAPFPAMIHCEGKILQLTSAWTELTGYTLKDIPTIEEWSKKAYGENAVPSKAFVESLYSIKSRVHDGEWEVKTKCGNTRIWDFSSSPIGISPEGNRIVMSMASDVTDRTEAKEALKIEKAFSESVMNAAADTIYIFNPETGQAIYWNQANMDILGYTNDEMKSRLAGSESFYKHEDLDRLEMAIKKCLAHGRSLIQADARAKDNSYIPFEYNLSLVERGVNERFICVIGRDISERKQAEEELKNEKSFSESVMNAANDIIYLFDPETNNAIYWNQAIMDIMNLSYNEVKEGLAGSASFHRTEDLPKIVKAINNCIESGQSNVQVDAFVKNKGYIPIDYNLSLINRGEEKQLICVIGRDITKIKQTEHLLRQSYKLLEASQSIAKVGGWELDIATNNLFWTAETYRIHETSPEEFDPTVDAGVNYFLPESRRMISEALKSAIEEGKGYDLVLETYTTKGRKIDVRTTCEVSFIGGLPSKLTGTFQDITKIKKAENALIKAKEKAEESDRLKSAFLANMSHEIRTPMNGILGFTDLLKSPNLSGEKQQKYIDIIEKSGARMLTTIHNIIDISIIESEQIQISLTDVDLNKQIDELYEFFTLEAEKKNIQFSIKKNLPNESVLIKTDEDKLNSILTNLIKNAIKYTQSGSINLSYELDTKSTPSLFHFSIKDTGIGIPKEKQETVFQRFIQADTEDRMVQEGSGLGLSIASAYVEKLGGKMQLESEVGVGSHFSFTIPIKENKCKKLSKTIEPSGIVELSEKKLQILIVEDEEAVIAYLKIILKKYEKDILVATNGADAVDICRNNTNLDLILMDIRIPEIDGHEATRRIREFNKEVYILAQTAFAQIGDREKCIAAGCNDFITKPINKNKLLELIASRF